MLWSEGHTNLQEKIMIRNQEQAVYSSEKKYLREGVRVHKEGIRR
jgi:hypothetical protein